MASWYGLREGTVMKAMGTGLFLAGPVIAIAGPVVAALQAFRGEFWWLLAVPVGLVVGGLAHFLGLSTLYAAEKTKDAPKATASWE
ncbi:hypothetical protein [Stackebrandtia albiflava]|nr:hypothetical protein [Stackebrandtia albiflava]